METMYRAAHVSTARRTDVRVKILYVLWVFVVVSVLADPRFLSAVLFLTVMLALAARLSLWELLRAGRFGFFVAAASFVLWILFLHKQGPAVFELGVLRITAAGLANGWSVAARIGAILLASLVVFRTTSAREVMTGLYRLRVSVPFAMVVGIVLRLIPQLKAEHAIILEAQRSRAVEFEKGGMLTRLRKHTAYIIPLVLRALKITSDLSLAMEARAFDPYARRTFSQDLRFDAVDILLITLMVASLAGLVIARIYGIGGMPAAWTAA